MAKKRILALFLILSFILPPPVNTVDAHPADAPLSAPVPGVALNVPAQVFIGEAFTFNAVFDNTSPSDVGFGPYVDIFLPQSGMDDASAAEKEDGITYTSVDYLGNDIRSWELSCAEDGSFTHPLTGLAVTCPPAPAGAVTPFTWQVLVVELPFGSFAPEQPAAAVTISAQLSDFADLNQDLPIYAQGGYRFGADALENPITDPPIIGARVSSLVTPSLLILDKIYNWREDETATGPNYPRTYSLTVDIPEDQTITNLVLEDDLPDNLQFIAVESTSPAASGCTIPSTTVPGGTLSCTFDSVTGGAGGADATVTFSFFIPLDDSAGDRVIDSLTGGCVISENPVSAAAEWVPLDPRDLNTPVSESQVPAHILEDCSHTIQKFESIFSDSPPTSYSPGDVVEYRLEFQISDFFAEDNFTVTDTLSDGQRYDPGFTPTLSIEGNTYSLAEAGFAPSNFTVAPDYTPADPLPNSGETTITFHVSDEIISRGQLNGRMIGGCVPTAGTGGADPDCGAYNDGPTTGVITFRVIIQEEFSDTFPSGDSSVDQGDLLTNGVIAAGLVLNNSDLTSTGNIASEDSAASFVIGYGMLTKSIYAVNGSTTFSSPVRLSPNDTITYRILYTMNTSDVEDLEVTDYLPLPVLDADELTVFDDVISAVPPPAGHIKFGESDTFRNYSGIVPALSVDSLNNSFALYYGDFDSVLNTSTVIDLLFTVTVSDDPFADGLYLTNQVLIYEGSTNHDVFDETAIIRFILEEPLLFITKGAVSSDRSDEVYIPAPPAPVTFSDPGGTCPRFTPPLTSSFLAADPLTSDISQVDAGDVVTFAIVLENRGHAGAYDVVVKDDMPAGFIVPTGGLNLCVTDGAGNPLAFTDLGGGFLGSGIELNDAAGNPALKPGLDDANAPNAVGDNLAVITFDLILESTIESADIITNTAGLTNYSGAEGGVDFTTEDPYDDVETIVRQPQSGKTLVTTSQAHTSGASLAIGEIATYDLTITIPEGLTSSALLTDNLPTGLAFVDCISITPSSADLTTDLSGGFNAACNDTVNPTVVNDGDLVQFTLGNLNNSNRDNAVAETLTVRFSAAALNISSNQHNTSLSNSAVFSWDGGSQTSLPAVVTVVEPAVTVAKTAVPTSGDAGDLVTFNISVSNPAGGVDAFNLTLDDIVPPELTYTGGSFEHVSGLAPDSLAEVPDLNASWASFPAGAVSVLRFTGTLKTSVTPGDQVTNDAIVKFTSLPGNPGQLSPYNPVSYERTGNQSDPGGTANDYTVTDPAEVVISIPTPLKYLMATSESHTADSNAAVGEIVRFRLSSAIPEGTSVNFQIRDLLPSGLLYLDDGTARLAFVSNGSGITSSTITCTNDVGVAGDPVGIASAQVDCTFPAGAITNAGGAGAFTPGNDPYFNFGDLTNADSDADLEFVIAEFNALVVNISGNQAGTNLANDFRVYEGGAQVADATNLTVRVVEPTLTVNKTVTPGPYDAGDIITYSVVISASSASSTTAAFDLVFTDTVNAALQVQSQSIVAPAYAGTADNSSGNSISFTISRLNPGDSATVTITALIPASAPVYLTIPNSAGIVYTSLPGSNGTAPNDTGSSNSGLPGTQNGERTGQDGAGGLNDYASQDSEPIVLSQPALDKRDAAPLIYTIGETATFPIMVTLPEGVTRGLEVVDNLPPGLDYVSSEVITTADLSGGLLAQDFSGSVLAPTISAPGGSGVDVVWTFGDVTSTADSGLPAPDNNRFLIRVTARVLDIPLNSGGDILENNASLSFTNPNTGSPVTINASPVNISLVEPVMIITKTFNPDQASINETVQVTLVVSNTGTSPAHDVIIEDLFPTAQFQSIAEVNTPVDFIYESQSAGGNITVRYSGGPILVGESRIFVFSVTTSAGFIGGSSFINIATVTRATTLPGDNAFERDEPDVNATDDLTGISPDLVLVKDDGTATAGAGDTLVYTLTIDNVGLHDAVNLTVTDTVPDGTVFDIAGSSPGWSCADGAPAGTVCTLFIPDLASGLQTTRTFAVRVDDPLGGDITQIVNTASVADDGTYGPDPTPGNNSDTDTDILAATSPVLSVEKVDVLLVDANSNGMFSAGDTLRYTITITNSGNQDAAAVVVDDSPDANSTLIVGTVVSSQGSVTLGNTPGDTSLRVSLGTIPGSGGSAVIQFDVRINDPLPAGTVFVENQAVVSGANFPDVNSDDPDYPGGVDPTVTLLDTSFMKALAGTDQTFTDGTDVAIGEIVTYEVTLNVPPGETRLASLNDVLGSGLAFVDCLSITPASVELATNAAGGFSVACTTADVTAEAPGSPDAVDQGRNITFDLGNLNNTSASFVPLVLRYRAVVLDSLLNQDGTHLSNSVTWTYESGSLSTSAEQVVIVEPDMQVSKSANRTTASNGTLVTFTLRVAHSAATGADAFDVVLVDTLPANLLYETGTFTQISGPPAVLDDTDPANLTTRWIEYPSDAAEAVFEFQVRVSGLSAGQSTRNDAALEWTSLFGDETLPRSVYNTLSTERFFDPPSNVNVYGDSAALVIQAPEPIPDPDSDPLPAAEPTPRPKAPLPSTK